MTFKKWLRGGLAATAGSVFLAGAATAGAPMVKTPAPGFHRMLLGEFEITALSDGTAALPMTKLLTNITPAKAEKLLARWKLKDPVETSVNAYLVNTGAKLVLVDAGAAGLFGPTLGKLLANLRAAGYLPEQVDAVLITHMHPDHVGGLMAGDKLAFPNATVHADKHDAEFWLSEANMAKAPKDGQDFFRGAMASIKPYLAAGRFKTFDGDTEIAPGVLAKASRGHTAGHSTYIIQSQGQKLVLWGDLLHVAAVQFAEPSVTIRFDTDAKAAAVQRKKAFAEAAKEGYWVAAAHLPFPGIGQLRTEGKGYAWIPANYSPMR